MELLEGIKSRSSIRAFKSDPVPVGTIMELLSVSICAPSSVNLQPWEFFVVMGEALKDLKHASLEEHRLGKTPNPELPIGEIKGVSPVLKGVFRERQVELAKQMFGLLGISKQDKEGMEQWNEKMVQFYNAPAVIIAVIDRTLQGFWPVLDIGFVTQNIVLAAQEYGLGSCVMRAIVDYPEQVRKIVGIPESKRIIIGIAIGYPGRNQPINRLKTKRERIDEIVTLLS
ncbi:MAG: nitroreductase [Deltaproteobacteria bacterium]|nr:nitroreductase [Deltaproteobacteria bacterium]